MVFYQTGPYLASLDVEVERNGAWVKVAEVGGTGAVPKSKMIITFEPQKTKSLRLANMTATQHGGPAFYEVEVYNDRELVDEWPTRWTLRLPVMLAAT